MTPSVLRDNLQAFEIPGRVTLLKGKGDLMKIDVHTDWSTAQVYLHGAHVTGFQKKGEPPLLFTSSFSRFASGQAIRGGIPVIFPWFGPRVGEPAHGFARLKNWELREATEAPEGGVSLRFHLPPETGGPWASCSVNYVVTITDSLSLELIVTNTTDRGQLIFENCLHTYFALEDIAAVSISGLKGVDYLDKVDNYIPKNDAAQDIRIASEVDRTYLATTAPVEILDSKLRRKIRIKKIGSASTVVWNPWAAKAQKMTDFGDEEYRQMVCVESGNVGPDKIELGPAKSSVLKVNITSEAI